MRLFKEKINKAKKQYKQIYHYLHKYSIITYISSLDQLQIEKVLTNTDKL